MSDAKNFLRDLGKQIQMLLGTEFAFYSSRLELRRKRSNGHDVVVLSGWNKLSPLIDVAFYFGRHYDAAKKIERAMKTHPMPYHIQQYSPNIKTMTGCHTSIAGVWEANIQSSSEVLAREIAQTIQDFAFPFFERFTELLPAREALANNDSWCFDARGAHYHMLFKIDAALDDLKHFRAWSNCLDEFYRDQAMDDLNNFVENSANAT